MEAIYHVFAAVPRQLQNGYSDVDVIVDEPISVTVDMGDAEDPVKVWVGDSLMKARVAATMCVYELVPEAHLVWTYLVGLSFQSPWNGQNGVDTPHVL